MRPVPVVLFLAALTTASCLPRFLEDPIAETPTPRSVLPVRAWGEEGATQQATAAKVPRGPRVRLEHLEGADPEATERAIVLVGKHLQECASGGTGTIRVRIQSDDASTRIAIEPGIGLESTTRRCVLEALSTVDIDDMAARSSPSFRASGFTALVRVEW